MENSGMAAEVGNVQTEAQASAKEKRSKTIEKINLWITFIGTLLSLIIFLNMPPYTYFAALALMAVGAWPCSSDEPIFKKKKH